MFGPCLRKGIFRMRNAVLIWMVLGIGLLLALGYLAFPPYQTALGTAGPLLLLVLLCPLLMYFGMRGMNADKKTRDHDAKK